MNHSEEQNYATKVKGKKGFRRIVNALRYSYDGIKAAAEEAGFRELLVLHGVLLTVLFFMPFTIAVKMVLIIATFISIIAELFNTAIEAAVDHTSLRHHPLAKRAKDVGSAAQYTSLSMIAVLWIMALAN